ncbi:threonine--tRNA ligase [Tuwongella immobilis]|uniref:Threonine--tRNA ligase n=1 Tax=Tuwongella immobilis TaxID=692036 RepID=A0A6C2YVN0_9BACT|nr:threonine--tRNA ligase [Tuwongella immobilis]VIP05039.1 threonyl-trna synthetase : Threonine--tRNA ligase OS=uncultured planctomycete GN=thrS PE=3 SV=1: TGS: tRNA_SAD: tRNA-synt_2b: HGTP_anticodon [Tuwongella immobilis]VTS07434.1 threonyl-trna synthetase : Threonine--tRNA ligase OS=uncultured planctomycete GN=thrS PE=3 SV=1: TGS: tRNA_SAD: tRNA-synt_2b: HGTP_anticodon [Tuwongella immobilis]
MATLKLPDGSTRELAPGTRSRDVAESIGKRLAQAAIAAKVNGTIVDLEREIPTDLPEVELKLLTDKDPESLDVLRHSCAHIMARAVMRLFPGTQLAFGPTIENGYYYDIDSPTPITEADFPRIEAEMKKIIDAAEPFERFERPTDEGKSLCADLKQEFKVEHISGELSKFPTVSFYRQGEFIDLCRGPHIPHAGKVGAFKILSIAGAYWKGDSSKKQLQRLYGTAFFSKKELDAYLNLVEEAKKRDHRVLGKQLKLFTISQQAGSGLILWMPKGAMVRNLLETFIKDELLKRGYSPVYTPHIGRLDLYRTSGHFPYYRDSQYPPLYFNPLGQAVDTWLTMLEKGGLSSDAEHAFVELMEAVTKDATDAQKCESGDHHHSDDELSISPDSIGGLVTAYKQAGDAAAKQTALREWLASQEGYLLKPMNCPHHIQIYKAQPRSYRDLPVRLAEFGTVYRFEQSGELSGMTRVRGFTQDDAHLFVTPEQVEAELNANLDLVLYVLDSLGLTDFRVRVSLRDPESNKYVGSDELWNNAEETLKRVVTERKLNYVIGLGEAAFYGPKIDFIVRDCIGREWQLGTVQLDYNLPNRFDLEYIGADNQRHRPVMIHRAPFGSMERFCGILIEHFAGSFPLWLAPEQARVIPLRDTFNDYAKKVESELRNAGFRVSGDYRHEDMRAKIRDASQEKVPYMIVLGGKEQEANTVALRDRLTDKTTVMALPELIALFHQEVNEKRIRQVSTATASMGDDTEKFSG